MAIITHLCCFCTWVMNDWSIKCSWFLPQGLVNHYLINKNFKQAPFSLIGQNFSPKERLNTENNVFMAAMEVSKQGIWMETQQRVQILNSKDESFLVLLIQKVSVPAAGRAERTEQSSRGNAAVLGSAAELRSCELCSPSLVLGFTADTSIKTRNLKITLRLT